MDAVPLSYPHWATTVMPIPSVMYSQTHLYTVLSNSAKAVNQLTICIVCVFVFECDFPLWADCAAVKCL